MAARIAEPQAPSTVSVYNSKWTHWLNWCEPRGINPKSPHMTQVAQFLNYLFNNCKLEVSTIEGYRASLQSAFRHKKKLQVGTDQEITALLNFFKRSRPPRSLMLPSWDISLVLWSLAEAPFEPINDPNKVPLAFLTWKLAFLLLLAAGLRRGEVHAIKRNGVFFATSGDYMTLSISPAFISKVRLRHGGGEATKPIRIPALKPILSSGMAKSLAMCPVRCLKTYLKRTKSLVRNRKLLFLGTQKNRVKDITKSTFSGWIKSLILYCYQNPSSQAAKQLSIRTHDLRGIGATMVFKGTPCLSDLLEAGTWKTDNTFLSHYLKDLSEINSDNLKKIGPIVAARHVILHN